MSERVHALKVLMLCMAVTSDLYRRSIGKANCGALVLRSPRAPHFFHSTSLDRSRRPFGFTLESNGMCLTNRTKRPIALLLNVFIGGNVRSVLICLS